MNKVNNGLAKPKNWLPHSFHMPEGKRNARIDEARRFRQGDKEIIRTVYKCEQEPGDEATYMAGKNYHSRNGRTADEALMDDLYKIVGDGVQEALTPEGLVDLEGITGMQAEIQIVYQKTDLFDEPYCRIVSIRPKAASKVAMNMDEGKPSKPKARLELDWDMKSNGIN